MEVDKKIGELIDQVIDELNLELVEYDVFQAGKRKILRVYIDKMGGVNVDDCAAVSRKLGALLELEDLIPSAYTLEVSSPGLDRPLKTIKDYQRNYNQMLRMSFDEKVEGKNFLIVELIEADDENVSVLYQGKLLQISYANILNAKVEVQFNG